MSNSYSLSALIEDLDREFAPYKLEIGEGDTLVLRNLLRVSDRERAAVTEALQVIDEVQSKDEDGKDQSPEDAAKMSAAVADILRAVTADSKGDRLVRVINGDLLLAMKILNGWMEATQPGEAQNSPA
jgi:hypothetical protein